MGRAASTSSPREVRSDTPKPWSTVSGCCSPPWMNQTQEFTPQEVLTLTERPILALTIGDPAGIGPEISLKSLAEPFAYAEARPFLVGSAKVLELAQQQSGTHLKFNIVNE